jgi:hypothetical protein
MLFDFSGSLDEPPRQVSSIPAQPLPPPIPVSDISSQGGAGDQHRSTHNGNLPLIDCLAPDSSIPADFNVPACRRLTSLSHPYLPHEVISLIEAVFKSKDEVKMIGYLRGDDAQTFIDVVHRVRPHPLHFRGTV